MWDRSLCILINHTKIWVGSSASTMRISYRLDYPWLFKVNYYNAIVLNEREIWSCKPLLCLFIPLYGYYLCLADKLRLRKRLAKIRLWNVDLNQRLFYFQVVILGLVYLQHWDLIGFLKDMNLTEQSLPKFFHQHIDLKLIKILDLVETC